MYKIKYIARTSSRYGYYDYHGKMKLEAENEAQARQLAKIEIPKRFGFKRCQVIIKSISEINDAE